MRDVLQGECPADPGSGLQGPNLCSMSGPRADHETQSKGMNKAFVCFVEKNVSDGKVFKRYAGCEGPEPPGSA